MRQHAIEDTWPCSLEQAFELAADVEHYPEFVPGWRRARVLARNGDNAKVWQEIGIGPVTLQFCSSASFAPPGEITIVSSDEAFREFRIHWSLTPARNGCRVSLTMHVSIRARLLAAIADPVLELVPGRVMRAFSERAAEIGQGPAVRDGGT